MATRFELVLEGDDVVRLRAAGEEALREIERLEARLSRYRAQSVVSALNAHAAAGPLRVDGEVLALLATCAEVSAESAGAFDIAVGPLVAAWRFAAESGRLPEPDALEAARACSGMAHVAIEKDASTVQFLRRGVSLDLGAAGKGYAIDRAIDRLQEAGVTRALLHGGTSSVHAIGVQENGQPWPVAWEPNPGSANARETFHLSGDALAISASHGRSFVVDGRTYGHVLDPRTGEPVTGARAACVRGPSSFMCDMLSTALLVRGRAWIEQMQARWPEYEGRTA
jgi:thiamine biosynthesis lipoprotein